jgi:hypothetical protein
MGIKDWQGGVIVKNPVTPSGPYENSKASGMWTMNQVADYNKQGIWPTAGREEPDVAKSFSTYLYDGNNSTQTITNNINLSGEGGMVWTKSRSYGYDHVIYDTVRGATHAIWPNKTMASEVNSNGVTAFNSNGYALGSRAEVNSSSETFVSWTFRKQAKFFDVVTYTGTGVAGLTVSHNLGSVPGMILLKRTDTSSGWRVYHRGANGGTNPEQYYAMLQSTNAFAAASTVWNNTAPTDSVFTVGTDGDSNTNNGTYVAYLFAHETDAESFIQCGSMTISGQATASVNLGFEAQLVMIKLADGTGNWFMFDVMRGMAVTGFEWIYANSNSAAEVKTYQAVFPTATGFSFNPVNNGQLVDGNYIYMAIRAPMMVAPSVGTEVFYVKNGDADFAADFPTDIALSTKQSSQPKYMMTRLLGDNYLETDTADAEAGTGISNLFADQTGVNLKGNWYGSSDTNTVGWLWKRAKGYFDVVAYTGTGSARTVSHNLGVAPEMMWVKKRSGSGNWAVYAAPLGATKYLILSSNGGSGTYDGYWNDTTPTSSVFSLKTDALVNASGSTYIAYLFATLDGISKVGSYSGTGTAQNIDCGFSAGARFILIKRSDSTGDWYLWDSARGISAGNDPYLLLNSSAAEVTNTDYVDPLNAGFTVTSSAPAGLNANGGTYIFYAIA